MTVGGEPLEKGQDGKYSFTVEANTTVSVVFQSDSEKYSSVLQGTWQLGSAAGNELTVEANKVTFNGEEVTPSGVTSTGFSFSVTDEEQTTFNYSVALKQVLTNGGKQYALVLSYAQSLGGSATETVSLYYYKEGVDYSYTFLSDFVGHWSGLAADDPISIEEDAAYMTVEAGKVVKGVVLSYTEATLTYVVVFDSAEYSLKLQKSTSGSNLNDKLVVKNLSDTDSTTVTLNREKEAEQVYLAAAYAGTYKNADGNVLTVDAEGGVTYQGTTVKLFDLNAGSSLVTYEFDLHGVNYRLYPNDAFTDTVSLQNYTANGNLVVYTRQHTADNYTLTYSAPVDGATHTFKADGSDVTSVAHGTQVTLTLTMKAGYLLQKVTVGGVDVTASLVESESADAHTYTYTFPVLTNLEVVATCKKAEGVTVTLSKTGDGTVSLNSTSVEGDIYSYLEGDTVVATVTAGEGNVISSLKLNNKEVSKYLLGGKYSFVISANAELSVTFAAKGANAIDESLWGGYTVTTMTAQDKTTGTNNTVKHLYLVVDATGVQVYDLGQNGFARPDAGIGTKQQWYPALVSSSTLCDTTAQVAADGLSFTFTLTYTDGSTTYTTTYKVCKSELGITYLEVTPAKELGTKKIYTPMVRYTGSDTAHAFTAPAGWEGVWAPVSGSASPTVSIDAHSFDTSLFSAAYVGEYEVLDKDHILVNGGSNNDRSYRDEVYLLTLDQSGDHPEVKVELFGNAAMDELTAKNMLCLNGQCNKYKVTVNLEEGNGNYSFDKESDDETFRGTVKLTITANVGWTIATVKVDGEDVEHKDGVITLDVQKEMTVDVTFEKVPVTYSVTVVNDDQKGTVTLSPEPQNGRVNENALLIIIVQVKPGWAVTSITVKGLGEDQVSNSASMVVSSVTADITIEVAYEKAYIIEVDKGELDDTMGTVSNGVSSVKAGTSYKMTITVMLGYKIGTFTVDGVDKLSELVAGTPSGTYTYSVESVNADMKFVVRIVEEEAIEGNTLSLENGTLKLYAPTATITPITKAYVVKVTLTSGTTVAGGLYVDVLGPVANQHSSFNMYDPTSTNTYWGVVVFDKADQKLVFSNKSGKAIEGTVSIEEYTQVEINETGKEYVVPVTYFTSSKQNGGYMFTADVGVKLASSIVGTSETKYTMSVVYPLNMTSMITLYGSQYSDRLITDGSNTYFDVMSTSKIAIARSVIHFGTTNSGGLVKFKIAPNSSATHSITVESNIAEAYKGISIYAISNGGIDRKFTNADSVPASCTNLEINIQKNTGWKIDSVVVKYKNGTEIKQEAVAHGSEYRFNIYGALTDDVIITVTFSAQ